MRWDTCMQTQGAQCMHTIGLSSSAQGLRTAAGEERHSNHGGPFGRPDHSNALVVLGFDACGLSREGCWPFIVRALCLHASSWRHGGGVRFESSCIRHVASRAYAVHLPIAERIDRTLPTNVAFMVRVRRRRPTQHCRGCFCIALSPYHHGYRVRGQHHW